MNLNLDNGFSFGIGAFETIAVYRSRPILCKEHFRRLDHTLQFLNIRERLTPDHVAAYLSSHPIHFGAVKVMVSENNQLILERSNPYTKEKLQRGMTTALSPVRRNDTSPLTYHKTLCYADSLLEKQRFAEAGIDEPLFLNTRGELTEGAVSNLFIIKGQQILTPPVSCGLLPGILRQWLIENHPVLEQPLTLCDLVTADECFLSNSLMGVMPVRCFGEHRYTRFTLTETLQAHYQRCFFPN